ncbi:MAG TPA: hypothetical protein VNF68_07855 [Candidatus Baltobacteraceae bacterium]|nr:hypothetical protein [Candidatus Baltobacteraceae bacterium]
MKPEHQFLIESTDPGTAVARLEPVGLLESHDVLALAQRSSEAAIHAVVRTIRGEIRTTPSESRLTHLRVPSGAVSAAALLECELTDDLADDVRRNGTARARVNVAVVDDAGETVALGSFEFFLARR